TTIRTMNRLIMRLRACRCRLDRRAARWPSLWATSTCTRRQILPATLLRFRHDFWVISMPSTLSLDAAKGLWEPAGPYLTTSSYGLPPRPAWEALQQALDEWRHGRTSWEHWNEATDRARALFAQLVGVPPERVAAGSTASTFVGVLAAAVPDGARVVVPDVDFASLLFPFLVHEQRLDLVTLPLDPLPHPLPQPT